MSNIFGAKMAAQLWAAILYCLGKISAWRTVGRLSKRASGTFALPTAAAMPRGQPQEASDLSLAELGRAAGGVEAVLLALLHTRVASQEPGRLQSGTELLVHQQQGPGNAVADGAGLTGDAAAGDSGDDVHLAHRGGGDQGLTDDELQGLQTEILLNVPAVDGDGAGAVGEEVHAGHRGLPTASAVVIGLFTLIHLRYPPYASV